MLAYTDEVLAADCDHGAHGVVASHPLRVRNARGSNPSASIGEAVPQLLPLRSVFGGGDIQQVLLYAYRVLAAGSDHGAHGVVASHPLRMRKALGSNPSVSIGAAVPQLRLWQRVTGQGNEQQVCAYAEPLLEAGSSLGGA